MFEIIQLQFEVYEFMNMTSPQRLRTGSSKVKSGKLPGKTLQKPHDRPWSPWDECGVHGTWLHRSDGSLLHDHPSQKKHKPGVDTWMRTSDFFHEDTPWYDMINAPSMDGSYSPIDERIRLSTKNQKRRTTSRSHQNYQPSFTVIITIIYLP